MASTSSSSSRSSGKSSGAKRNFASAADPFMDSLDDLAEYQGGAAEKKRRTRAPVRRDEMEDTDLIDDEAVEVQAPLEEMMEDIEYECNSLCDHDEELDFENPSQGEASMDEGDAFSEDESEAAPEWNEWATFLELPAKGQQYNLDMKRVIDAANTWCRQRTTLHLKRRAVEEIARCQKDPDAPRAEREKAVRAFMQCRQEFDRTVAEFLNRYWAVVTRSGAKPFYVEYVEVRPSATGEPQPQLLMRSKDGFVEAYANCRMTVWEQGTVGLGKTHIAKKSILIVSWWLHSLYRRQCNQLMCDPTRNAEDYDPETDAGLVNQWHGMNITPQMCAHYRQRHPNYQSQAEPVFHHLLKIWCKDDDTLYQYVVRWLALTIQKPEVKIGVAIVVIGEQGAGKGVIFNDFLVPIIGPQHTAQITGMKHLLGKFNAEATVAKKLKGVDEALFGGNKQDVGQVKSMITEPTIRVEKKFLDAFHVSDFANFLIFSNEPFPVVVEKKDRRFCCLETDNCYSGSQTQQIKRYFDRLRAVPVQAVAAVLYEMDLSDFNPRAIPDSPFRQSMQVQALSQNSVAKWLLECLNAQELPQQASIELHPAIPPNTKKSYCESARSSWEKWRVKSSVYQHYKGQAGHFPEADCNFWKELAKLLGNLLQTKSLRQLVEGGPNSLQLVSFGTLSACREAFAKAMGTTTWKWDD